METKFLNQYLIVSTFEKAKEISNFDFLNSVLKKEYLKTKLKTNELGFYTYSDALVAIANEANTEKRLDLINKVLETTDSYIINDLKKNPPFAEYIMMFLNYLYFELYYGSEKCTHPKKIKFFIRNEKSLEISQFKNTVISNLGEDNPISYKVGRIAEIISNFNYKDIEEFNNQIDKITEYIDRIFKNLINLDAYPINFIFKNLYIPYKALVFRVNGDKESKEAEQFNFLTNKTLLALNSYSNLSNLLKEFKIVETDFSYLKTLVDSPAIEYKAGSLYELSQLMCKIEIEVSDIKLDDESKQIMYLFYKDIETIIFEYINLIEYLM